MADYFIKKNESEQGPITSEELINQWEQGEVGFSTKVRQGQTGEWKALSEVLDKINSAPNSDEKPDGSRNDEVSTSSQSIEDQEDEKSGLHWVEKDSSWVLKWNDYTVLNWSFSRMWRRIIFGNDDY